MLSGFYVYENDTSELSLTGRWSNIKCKKEAQDLDKFRND